VRVGLAAVRRGRSLVGMAVVDPDGIEIGYVSSEEPTVLVLGEGSSGRMRLGRRFVSGVVDRITLSGPVAQIFTGLNVVDSDGEFVGIVRDTNEADDVLDSLIVEDEQGEMVNVLLEDVRAIDEWVELSVSGDSLYEKT
jgi:sporulation protein YlmC with PRC-barrel domain